VYNKIADQALTCLLGPPWEPITHTHPTPAHSLTHQEQGVLSVHPLHWAGGGLALDLRLPPERKGERNSHYTAEAQTIYIIRLASRLTNYSHHMPAVMRSHPCLTIGPCLGSRGCWLQAARCRSHTQALSQPGGQDFRVSMYTCTTPCGIVVGVLPDPWLWITCSTLLLPRR
jgi:hypothetical protein